MAKKRNRENEIVSAKLDIYDNADDELVSSLGPTEKAILKAVNGIMNKLDTKDGKLVNTTGTLTFINELNKEVKKILKKSTYGDKVDAYLRKFERLDTLNQELHKIVNNRDISNLNLNPIKTQAIEGLSRQLGTFKGDDGSVLDANLVKPVKDIMFQSVVTGMTLEDAKAQLNLFITGDEKKLGFLRRYTSQIARDAITQYDGLVNGVIAREYGLNAYRYVGSLIEDSRAQCVRWVAKGVLPIATLEQEIKRAETNGSGMIPDTTPETFATYRGGYNCRHMAIPFRKVEKE
jgi:hypothetical protein